MLCHNELSGLNVLVTRPKPQGEELSAAIRTAGGKAVFFPTLEICPPSDPALFQASLEKIPEFDWLIFISPQAVLQSAEAIKKNLSAHTKVAAIGASTAEALRAKNITVQAFPIEEWSSEGLLDLPDFQNIQNKKIALICGEDGRNFLAKELAVRGAIVTYIYAYKRALPNKKLNLNQSKVNVVVCASNKAMDNLLKLTDTKILQIPLVVISIRMLEHAKQLGFKTIFLANNASLHAILETLANVKGSIMTEPVQARRSFPWLTFIVLILLLAAAISAGYFAYYYILPMQKTAAANVSGMQTKLQQVEQTQSTLQTEVQQRTDEIKSAMENLQQSQNNNKIAWKLLEAQYLVNLADINLKFGNNNIGTAITILQAADQTLKDTNDSKVTTLRQAIANDIATLEGLPKEDVVGTYTHLMALNDQVDKLPLPKKATVEEANPASTENLSWWRSGLKQSWAALQKIVVIRYHEGGTLPLLTPEQQDFLYANLHAVLEKSMWALLHKQPEIYQSSLDQAINWTKKYFVQDASETQSMLNELNALKQVNVRPDVPTLGSLNQISS